MHPGTYVVFIDCQTSGTQPKSSALVELGWKFGPFESPLPNASPVRSSLIRIAQDRHWSPHAARITGISQADLAEAPTIDSVWAEFLAELKSVAPMFAVIHYARFELSFLSPLHTQLTGVSVFPVNVVCTNQMAKRLLPRLPAHGIRAVSGFLGWELPPERRRAEDHVKATEHVWYQLIKELNRTHALKSAGEFANWIGEKTVHRKNLRHQFSVTREQRLAAPLGPGIYRMLSSRGGCLYIGKATSLRQRVNHYFQRGETGRSGISEMLAQVAEIDLIPTATALEAALLETDEIKRYDPPYNRLLRRGRRTVVYRARDFRSYSHCRSFEFPFGPFISSRTFDSFDEIFALLVDERLMPEFFAESVTALQVKEGVIGLWMKAGLGEFPEPISETDLLRLCRTIPSTIALSPEKEEGQNLDSNDSLLATLDRRLRRVFKKIRAARWLERLAHCHLAWQPTRGTSWRYLIWQDGKIVERGDALDVDAILNLKPPAPKRLDFDVETYDRLRIFGSELKNLAQRLSPLRIVLNRRIHWHEHQLKQYLASFSDPADTETINDVSVLTSNEPDTDFQG